MKIIMALVMGLFFVFVLTGCFAEDYDVSVPTAHLYFDSHPREFQLTEANISWNTASEDVQETVEDIEKYASSLDTIVVPEGKRVYLDFKENEENGGDIWTNPRIQVFILKNNEREELLLDELGKFNFPTEKGNYVLEVEFASSAGKAQYVGNIVIS